MSIKQVSSGPRRGIDRVLRIAFARRRPMVGLANGHMPDWCNLGVTLRVVLGVNAFLFITVALQPASDAQRIIALWDVAAVGEPVLFSSLLIGCTLRRFIHRWPQFVQQAVMASLPAGLMAGFRWGYGLPHGDGWFVYWRAPLAASAIGCMVLYWARLRFASFRPALAQAKMQALQARIRPHFLFNSLNAVLSLIRIDPPRAEQALEDLAELYRVLIKDRRERVTLDDEIAICKRYLDVESLRLGSRLVVRWSVSDEVRQALVPSLLLQPLVENAVYHGVEPCVGATAIDIRLKREGAQVKISVTNPVNRTHAAERRGGSHMALDNVRQRLALLHDLEGRLETSVSDGRFEVRLQLPYVVAA